MGYYYSSVTITKCDSDIKYRIFLKRSGGEGEAKIEKFKICLDPIDEGLFVTYDTFFKTGKICLRGVKKYYDVDKKNNRCVYNTLRVLIEVIERDIVRLSKNKDISESITHDPMIQHCLSEFLISLPV